MIPLYLESVGIDFVDPDQYSMMKPDHIMALDEEKRTIEFSREADLKNAEEEARKYAGEKTKAEDEEFRTEATELYREKIIKDPALAAFYKKYTEAEAAYDKAIRDARPSSVRVPFLGYIGSYPSMDGIERALSALEIAELPDPDLLAFVTSRYTSGLTAEYCKVYPYGGVSYYLKEAEKGAELRDPELLKYYRSRPELIKCAERYDEVKRKIWRHFYEKNYASKSKELTDAAEAEYERKMREYRSRLVDQFGRDHSEVVSLIKKLQTVPAFMDKMVRFTYDEIKKRDGGMDKSPHVDMIDYHVRYEVFRDRIQYIYDSGYSNPLSEFLFEENNYKLLSSDAQCCAVALVVGQRVVDMLKEDPGLELADISAKGNYAYIDLHIAYPNPEHERKIELF